MQLSTRSSFRWAVSFTAAVFILKAVYLSLTTARGLGVTSWLIDDTFIIMRIARNIAQGHGFTVDFTNITTGAPPLWTYLTSVNHLIFSLEWAVKMTLIESTLLGSLATFTVYMIARTVSRSEVAAWIALLLSTFTANAFFQAMNGMDTSLFTLLALLAFASHLKVGVAGRMSETKRAIVTGVLAGILTLVRADGVFVIGTIGLSYLTRLVVSREKRAGTLRSLVAFAVSAGVFVGILVSWNMLNGGSPLVANQVGRREMAMSLQGFTYERFAWPTYLKIVVWYVFELEKLLSIALGSSLLAFAALLYGFKHKGTKGLSRLVAVYSGTFFLLLVTYQWYFPDMHGLRYVNPAVHLLFVLMGVLIADLLGSTRYGKKATVLLCLSIMTLSLVSLRDMIIHLAWSRGTTMTGFPSEEQLQERWKMVDWINENLPKDVVIGIRDYGRESLFTNRPVQDLSGNTDPLVPVLARTSGLAAHLKERNVQYVLIPALDQRQDLIYQVLHRDLVLVPVKGAPVELTRHLYKVDWARTRL